MDAIAVQPEAESGSITGLAASPHAAAAALFALLAELPQPLLPSTLAELADGCAAAGTGPGASSGAGHGGEGAVSVAGDDEEQAAEGGASAQSVCSSPQAALQALASCGLPLPGGTEPASSGNAHDEVPRMALLRCVLHVARAALTAQGHAVSGSSAAAQQVASELAQVLFPPLPDGMQGACSGGAVGAAGQMHGRMLCVLQLIAAAEL